ncbi:hypothetical protein AVEN_48834-1 [Araneus ventricosus]|uniref:Uncharacterized protein n=1 Tax=Araneus ventricosus TaxID=182803 RepID=A0A4Y2AG51_ARAVE|nr:hypothetical protein AVEN_48834-1 [Araneus ventricosus]
MVRWLGRQLIRHSLSKLPHHTNEAAFDLDGFSLHQTRLHCGSSEESGFELRTLLSRSRNLTTRPPRPGKENSSETTFLKDSISLILFNVNYLLMRDKMEQLETFNSNSENFFNLGQTI